MNASGRYCAECGRSLRGPGRNRFCSYRCQRYAIQTKCNVLEFKRLYTPGRVIPRRGRS